MKPVHEKMFYHIKIAKHVHIDVNDIVAHNIWFPIDKQIEFTIKEFLKERLENEISLFD